MEKENFSVFILLLLGITVIVLIGTGIGMNNIQGISHLMMLTSKQMMFL